MKKLLITFALCAGIITPSLYSMNCESVIDHQYHELMQKNMLTLIAKAQNTIKILVQEVQGYQATFQQIKKLAQKGDAQAIANLITSLENGAAMEDESEDNDMEN